MEANHAAALHALQIATTSGAYLNQAFLPQYHNPQFTPPPTPAGQNVFSPTSHQQYHLTSYPAIDHNQSMLAIMEQQQQQQQQQQLIIPRIDPEDPAQMMLCSIIQQKEQLIASMIEESKKTIDDMNLKYENLKNRNRSLTVKCAKLVKQNASVIESNAEPEYDTQLRAQLEAYLLVNNELRTANSSLHYGLQLANAELTDARKVTVEKSHTGSQVITTELEQPPPQIEVAQAAVHCDESISEPSNGNDKTDSTTDENNIEVTDETGLISIFEQCRQSNQRMRNILNL